MAIRSTAKDDADTLRHVTLSHGQKIGVIVATSIVHTILRTCLCCRENLSISYSQIHVPARSQTLHQQSPPQLQSSHPALSPISYSATRNLTSPAPSNQISPPVDRPALLHEPRYSRTSSTLSSVHHHVPPACRIMYSLPISNGTLPHSPVEKSNLRVSVYVPPLGIVRKSSLSGSPPSRQMSSG